MDYFDQAYKKKELIFAGNTEKKPTIETMTIDGVEFIRRFLLHVLPKGFMRIRHYGFPANRCKNDNLKKCRKLSGLKIVLEICTRNGYT